MTKIIERIIVDKGVDWQRINHRELSQYLLDGNLVEGDNLLVMENHILFVSPNDSGKVYKAFAYAHKTLFDEDIRTLKLINPLLNGIKEKSEAYNTCLAEAVVYQATTDMEGGDMSALYEMIYRLIQESNNRILTANIMSNYLEEDSQEFLNKRLIEF